MQEAPNGGEEVVTSSKRNTIFGIALGLAIAAVAPMTALAKPVPLNQDVQDHGQYQLGPGEIPVLSPSTVHAQPMELGLSEGKILALGLGEKAVAKSPGTVHAQAMELGLSQGKILALGLAESGSDGRAVAKSTDDRSFSRATAVDPSPVVNVDDGRSIDVNPYTVTGFSLALLLAIGFGMGIAIRQSRKTKLSPA
jgi:hypothetical protein